MLSCKMYKRYLLEFLILINLMMSASFISSLTKLTMNAPNAVPINCECNERVIYRQYLLGLRKTRRYLHNTTNINKLVSILNFTNEFVANYTVMNNTDATIKNIVMGNIVLDVSNVKEIHISTSKDKIIVELDKQKKSTNILENLNNIETIIGTLSLLGRIVNIT